MVKKSQSQSVSTNSLIFGGLFAGFAAIAVIGLICITLFKLPINSSSESPKMMTSSRYT